MTGADDGLAAAAGALPRRLLCATRVNARRHSKSALIDWWHLGMLVLRRAGRQRAGRQHVTGEDRRNLEVWGGVTAAGWAVTIAAIAALLGFDLLLATVRQHAVGYREATAWSAFYIAVRWLSAWSSPP